MQRAARPRGVPPPPRVCPAPAAHALAIEADAVGLLRRPLALHSSRRRYAALAERQTEESAHPHAAWPVCLCALESQRTRAMLGFLFWVCLTPPPSAQQCGALAGRGHRPSTKRVPSAGFGSEPSASSSLSSCDGWGLGEVRPPWSLCFPPSFCQIRKYTTGTPGHTLAPPPSSAGPQHARRRHIGWAAVTIFRYAGGPISEQWMHVKSTGHQPSGPAVVHPPLPRSPTTPDAPSAEGHARQLSRSRPPVTPQHLTRDPISPPRRPGFASISPPTVVHESRGAGPACWWWGGAERTERWVVG